jgi:signal peptide peptidase SppA
MNDDLPYHRIADRFYNRPLLLLPSTAETVSNYLLSRVAAGARGAKVNERGGETVELFRPSERQDGSLEYHTARASRFHGNTPLGPDGRPEPFRRTPDGSAIITLVGEFVNRGAWVGASSGLISYEGFKYQIGRAAADPQTHTIVLDIESPGGEAIGCFEAAEAVRKAAAVKRVVAVVNGMAASAAYAIASGATRVISIPTGIVGSIGVVMVHMDFSKFLDEEGVKPTIIFSGEHKKDGNPFEPLPESVRADFQRECDSFYAQFVDTVAAGRKGLSKDSIRKTEARVFKGQDAVDAGLADAVGTFEQVLAELSSGSGGRANPPEPKGPMMNTQLGAPSLTGMAAPAAAPAKATTVAELEAAFPDLVATMRTSAATAERDRILGIEAIATAGHADLVSKLKADGKTTPAEAALQILGAEKQIRSGAKSAIENVETTTSKVAAAPSAAGTGADAPKAATPEQWKEEYAKSDSLKQEFATGEQYVAFKKAEASGQIRVLHKKSA